MAPNDRTQSRAPLPWTKRERQIMDVVYSLGSATAAEIHRDMEDPPTYTTVRGLLRVLVEKGQLAIERDGARYVYRPTLAKGAAGRTMLAHVVRTFFGGSASSAMHALLGSPDIRLSEAELERLHDLIDSAEADKR